MRGEGAGSRRRVSLHIAKTDYPPTQPGGFFSGFAAGGAMLMVSLSIRRSLVRPALPANRTERPIAARCVSEAQEEWYTWLKLPRSGSPQHSQQRAPRLKDPYGHADVLHPYDES